MLVRRRPEQPVDLQLLTGRLEAVEPTGGRVSSEEGPVLPFPIQVPNVDQALTPERRGIISQLEALLFAAGEPVGEQTLLRLWRETMYPKCDVAFSCFRQT